MSLVDQWLQSQGGDSLTAEIDGLSQVEKWMMQQETERIRLQEEEERLAEENRINEVERKAAEVEAARVPEKPTFDEIEKYMINAESSGNKDSVNVNDDETMDVSLHGINERWINQFPTSGKEDPENNGIKPWEKQKDGTLDPVYAMIHDHMREQIPNWDSVSDSSRLEIVKDEVYSQPIARFIHDYRGPGQWRSRDRFMEAYQTDLRSQSVDSLAAGALQGNNPTLEDIASRINLDSNIEGYQEMKDKHGSEAADKWAGRQASILGRQKTEDEYREERLFEAERPKGFFDALAKYAHDPVKLVPFLSTSSDVKQIVEITGIMNRIDEAEQAGEELNEDDMLRLYEFQLNNRSEKSWGYLVGTILGELPGFAGEIGLTGGTYTGAKAITLNAGKLALKKALGKAATKKTAAWLTKKGALQATAKFSGEAASSIVAATVQAGVIETVAEGLHILPGDWAPGGRIRKGMVDRMMGDLPISENERGELEAGIFQEGDDWDEAFARSVTDYWIELVSERSGGSLRMLKGLGAQGRKVGMKYAWTKKMLELNPKKSIKEVNQLAQRVGWHGILGEMFEERVGEVARGTAYKLGMDDEGFQWKRPTLRQMSAEFVGFGIGGRGIMMANSRTTNEISNAGEIVPPGFDLTNPVEVKEAIKTQGFTVKVVKNKGKYDVNTYIGESIIRQSIGHKDKANADAIAESMEKDLTHLANAKTVTTEEDIPIMEEGTTVEAKPWFSKEADAIREKIRQEEEASDLSKAVPTSWDITENLEKIYGSVETVEEDVADQKVNYNIMSLERLQKEARDKGKSDKGNAKQIIARLEVEVTRPDIKKGVLAEHHERSAKLSRLQEDVQAEIDYENELSAPDPTRLEVLNKDLASIKLEKERTVQYIHKLQGVKPKVKAKPKEVAPVEEAPAVEAPAVTPAAEEAPVVEDLSKISLSELTKRVEDAGIEIPETGMSQEDMISALTETKEEAGEAIPPQGLAQEEDLDVDEIEELSEEDQKQRLKDIDDGMELGFLGITPKNLKILGNTVIGAGRFTFQTLPKFIQKQGKNLGVTSDNFKQKWDEYSADPAKAPQKLKAYMKKVFTHMKKWYGKGKDAVVEYLKNPKIGAMIEVVGEAKAERPLAPKPIDFKKAPLKNKNDIVYTYIFDKGISKAEFIKDYMSVAQSKESRKGLSRGGYKIELSKMYDKGKKEYKKGVTKLVKNAQTKQGLKETFESGKHMMNWYDGFFPYIQKKFGKDAGLVADFIAVTSAGANLNANIGFGLKAYSQYKLGEEVRSGRFFTDKESGEALKRNIANAISNHEKGTSLKIGDRKITNFSNALKGDPNAVVLDMWMGREFGFDMDKKTALSDSQYRKYEQIVKEIAFDMGVTPRQAQAAIWFGVREGHSPMYKGDPGGLDSVTYEQILERTMPNYTYTGKDGKEHSLTDLNKDTIVYLNGSFGLTPEMLDTIGKALVDTGRYVYDNLSPSMQKMGNRLGVNAQNFKLKFSQFKNDAKGMTDNAKKWFKKVVGQMKTWFKKNAQNLIDSKPAQRAYDRLENMVVLKAVPDGVDIIGDIQRRAEESVKPKTGDKEFYDEVGSIGSQDKIDREEGGGFISTWLLSLSDRLKDIKGGMGILRLLRKYESHTLNIAKDVKAAEPMFKFLKRLKKKSKKDFAKLEFSLFTGNKAQIDKILDKYDGKMRYGDVKQAYKDMRGVLDSIYYRAMGLEKEEKAEYDKLGRDIAENAGNVPNNNWSVKKIKKWMQDNEVKFTSKDRKADLLGTISGIKGMKGKMDSLAKNIERFNELDKKIIYRFPFWGDGDITMEYFPRNTIDYYKLREFLKGKVDEGQVDKMLDDLAKKHNLASKDLLSDEVSARAIDAWLRSSGAKQRGAKPGASKGRIIDMLDLSPKEAAKLMSFYQDPSSSLMTYIYEMNEATARQQLFGKGVDINIGENDNHLAAYISGLVTGQNKQGVKIDAKDQQEILSIFRARFSNNWGKYASALQRIKNLTYMTTIADFWSTIMQFGDIFDAAYRSGNPVIFLKAFAQSAMPGISPAISAKKEGFVRISAEYSNDAESFAKALNVMFKWSGFSTIDRIGKETLVNATIMKITKDIKAGKLSPKTQMLIENAFGERAEAFIENVRKDDVSAELEEQRHADLVELAYWTLLEHQPVAESEMPAKYLESPEMRMAYQLKTWAMKKISFWRSETRGLWKRGNKVEAVKQGVFIATLMVLAGASPDIIRDILRGRPVHLKDSDLWVDTLLRLFGISKFGVMKAWRRSELGSFAAGFVPALGLADAAIHDVKYLDKWLKWHNNPRKEDRPEMLDPRYGLKFINQIPQVGKTIYNGIPNPFVPRDAEDFMDIVEALPDQDDGYIPYLQGWRGRYQTLKRQEDYYNDLEEWGREQEPRRRLTDFERKQRRMARRAVNNMEREQDRNGRALHRWLNKAEKRLTKESEAWMDGMERTKLSFEGIEPS